MQTNHRDLMIVGFGLAGANLAWKWVETLGRTAWIIDPLPKINASRVAAGILNPVTGKRLAKSWQVDALMPAARSHYRHVASRLGGSFYHDQVIRRIYQSEDELAMWEKRSTAEAYQRFLGKRWHANSLGAWVDDPLGSFEITGVGNLDTDDYLDHMIDWARDRSLLIQDTCEYRDIELQASGIRWHDHSADHVVFCEGFRAKNNPWFGHLPFAPAKGEILTLEGIPLATDCILSKQKWVLPLPGDRIMAGSTWSWDNQEELPTTQGRTGLLQGLSKMIPDANKATIVSHRAGVRPCTRDRLPFLGTHPVHPRLHLFNGFGSKGALLTPLLADQFTSYLTGAGTFFPEANIKRVFDV
jgi:glycine oxidase